MDRIADLVAQLEPETGVPSPDVVARQREVLHRAMATVGAAPTPQPPGPQPPAPRRLRRTRYGRWSAALASAGAVAVAVAVLVAVLVPGSPSPRGTSPTRPVGSAVLLAITRALAATGHDVEEARTTSATAVRLSATSWVDVATGACRTDTAIDGQRTLTTFVEHGAAVLVDYGRREWWTRRTGGVTCEPLTPQAIEHEVTTGGYTVAGETTLDGQRVLRLVSTTTSTGPHPAGGTTTLWVGATTYLPIEATSTGGARTVFTWLPGTAANRAALAVSVPQGFEEVPAPPPEHEPVGLPGGVGRG